MPRLSRLGLVAGLVAWAAPAQASDFSGILTLMVGMPTLAVACLVAGALFAFPASRGQRIAAAALFGPVLLAGLWLMPDAWSLRRMGPMPMVLYGGLWLGLLALTVALLRRKAPPDQGLG